MIDPANIEALRTIREAAAGDVTWALTGSLSFALQGVPVDPTDVDVQTDEPGAYALERRLSRLDDAAVAVRDPVSFSTGDGIRSHFGVLAVGGVRVEVMGALQKRVDGNWEPPVDVAERRTWIAVDGRHGAPADDWSDRGADPGGTEGDASFRVPVLPLAYEATAYERLGRSERAALLREHAGEDGRVEERGADGRGVERTGSDDAATGHPEPAGDGREDKT